MMFTVKLHIKCGYHTCDVSGDDDDDNDSNILYDDDSNY